MPTSLSNKFAVVSGVRLPAALLSLSNKFVVASEAGLCLVLLSQSNPLGHRIGPRFRIPVPASPVTFRGVSEVVLPSQLRLSRTTASTGPIRTPISTLILTSTLIPT